MKRKYLVIFIVLSVLVGFGAAWLWHTRQTKTSESNATAKDAQPAMFNKQKYSIDDPTSMWVVVNKQRQLQPANYAPNDLVMPSVPLRTKGEEMMTRKVTADALSAMFAGAKKEGVDLMISSGYRSYTFQNNLYNRYVAEIGQESADTQSARPGYSEHQTGLAVDVEPLSRQCEVEACFADTPEGKWVAANAYKYGFIIRYPADKTQVTGYTYEPWHLRYIGTELSNQLHQQNVETLEEFFGLPAAPNYN